MPELVDLRCPRCGAQLPQRASAGTYTCTFCRNAFSEKPPPAAASPLHAPFIDAPRSRVVELPRSKGPTIVFYGLVLTLALAPVIIGIVITESDDAPPARVAPAPAPAATHDKQMIVFNRRDALVPTWIHDAPAYLVLASSNDDKPSQDYLIARATGKNQQLWRAPLGDDEGSAVSTLFAVFGKQVVVTYKRKLHLLDLSTGAEQSTAELTDVADRVCVSSKGDLAYVHLVDGDWATMNGSVTTDKPYEATAMDCSWGVNTPSAPQVDDWWWRIDPRTLGFQAHELHPAGLVALATGTKVPGTASPMVFAYDPKERRILWKDFLSAEDPDSVKEGGPPDDFVDGVYASRCGRTSGGEDVVVWDIVAKRRLFEVRYGNSIEAIRIGAGFVYVTGTLGVRVYDLKNGAFVESFGS